MSHSHMRQLIVHFGIPVLYAFVAMGLAFVLLYGLHIISGPVRLSGVLGAMTGMYIVWFWSEGRHKIAEVRKEASKSPDRLLEKAENNHAKS